MRQLCVYVRRLVQFQYETEACLAQQWRHIVDKYNGILRRLCNRELPGPRGEEWRTDHYDFRW